MHEVKIDLKKKRLQDTYIQSQAQATNKKKKNLVFKL